MKGRMLKIARYLEQEKISSYKEISEALNLKERIVRYDVECINNELSLKKLPLIEKHSKGILFVPDELDFSEMIADDDFVFSPEERLAFIRMQILFDTGSLNIRALSESLQVSRRSIQNDIETVQNELKNYQLTLEYNKRFQLKGESELTYQIRSRELKRYIWLLYKKKIYSTYERRTAKLIREIFLPIHIDDVLEWVNDIIEKMEWVFSDESYQWYVSNVLTFTWYMKNNMELPLDYWDEEGEIDNRIEQYETCIGRVLKKKERGILSGFSKYTSRYVHLDSNMDLISIENITMNLIKKMEELLHVDFFGDGILMKGLLNHIGPMIERVKGNMQLNEEAESLIPSEYFYVFQDLKELVQKDEVLYCLTKNEIVYLAMYFLGSLRRMQRSKYMNVLLICGFGYGTTVLVKDALLNEYQVHVKKCISAYQVKGYQEWDEIDAVVSTVKIELPVHKKMAQVNVIFEKEDHEKLEKIGLHRKTVLTNYFAIEKRLDFLDKNDREKVMGIIKSELGYRDVRMPKKYYTISDLMGKDEIKFAECVDDWKTAVKYCTEILEEKGKITKSYYESIIQGMKIQGFYAVIDGEFVLLHGNEAAGVKESGMSLLISKEPVCFGEKKVNIIFCLASRDKKEHVPAVIRLMRMIRMTNFIDLLKESSNSLEAAKIIQKCEQEVEICYQS